MSHDTRLQQAKRSGDATELLKARLHSGELSGERLRVAAHSKDYAAKEVVGSPCCCRVWPCRDDCTDRQAGMNLADWTTGLLSLAAACARVVPCSACGGSGKWREPVVLAGIPASVGRCHKCIGTGRVSVEIPAEQHLAVVVGVAVARACWEESKPEMCRTHEAGGCSGCIFVPEAIEAVERWLVEPSESNRDACYRFAEESGLDDWAKDACFIIYHGSKGAALAANLAQCLASAAALLGEQRVREIAAEAARNWALR